MYRESFRFVLIILATCSVFIEKIPCWICVYFFRKLSENIDVI